LRVLVALALAASLAACGKTGPEASATALEKAARPINDAEFEAEPAKDAAPPKAGYSASMLKLEVLLDRARFSPGLIDGRFDENLRHALMAYRQANAMRGDSALDKKVWTKLTMADPRAVLRAYTIDADDVAGPFTPAIPKDLPAMARLDLLGYASPAEELAEAFHMDPALLVALNPGSEFRAGDTVLVADRGADDLGADVYRVEVDAVLNLVRAFGAKGDLLATYPATVGSLQSPPLRGLFTIETVAAQPNYDYQSGQISLGGPERGATVMPAGPNSPVGVVWIGLSAPGCGIQGVPDPAGVGKPSGRGCVRLTNWDARELARGVRPGVAVAFR
jgi:lipoprotein-anchoring transpeptidase ErfK/SrfK/predicted small lipoprotein YifL